MIITLYAPPLALLFIILAIRVIRVRRRLNVAIGDGDDAVLSRAIRAHANFAEYVPFALLLLWMLESAAASPLLLHALAALLLVGRVLHALAVSHVDENLTLRVAGMAATFTVLAVTAITLLARTLSAT